MGISVYHRPLGINAIYLRGNIPRGMLLLLLLLLLLLFGSSILLVKNGQLYFHKALGLCYTSPSLPLHHFTWSMYIFCMNEMFTCVIRSSR